MPWLIALCFRVAGCAAASAPGGVPGAEDDSPIDRQQITSRCNVPAGKGGARPASRYNWSSRCNFQYPRFNPGMPQELVHVGPLAGILQPQNMQNIGIQAQWRQSRMLWDNSRRQLLA